MTLSKASFAVGAAAVGLGVVAALTGSPVVGGVTALVAVAAWYLQDLATEKRDTALLDRAANAEKEALELKRRLAWRAFSQEEIAQLVVGLSNHRGREVIVRHFEDKEAARLAGQIADAFTAAGWVITSPNRPVQWWPHGQGIVCEHPENDEAARLFIQVASAANFPVTERNREDLLVIMVEPRPAP
jgi:hypothetical protein